VRERFGRTCCRETIRAALHRLGLSWKKKLLGRADPQRRQAFVEQIQDPSPVPSATAIGWSTWTKPTSTRMPISALVGRSAAGASGLLHTRRVKLSFYGLYLYNEGEVRLWPYARANGAHTIDVLRRLRAEWPS
jgi:Winged helix-turn helix